MEEELKQIGYASFFLRVAARIVDVIVIFIFFKFLEFILPESIGLGLMQLILFWLYFTLLESSNWKGSLGKKFVGIEIVDYEGLQITFKQANIRFISSIISVFIPPLLLTTLFTKKKQTIHDMLGKTVVLKIESTYDYSKVMGRKKTSLDLRFHAGRKLGYMLVLIFVGLLLYSLYPIIGLVAVYGYMGIKQAESYNKSFHTKYKEKDYNDSRIEFYRRELDKSSKYAVNADGIVNIFEHDTKVDLSLECIERYLQENNASEWIDESSDMRKNARNKYTITEDLIEKAKYNEKNMGRNFYLYDMNLVQDVSDEITGSWRDKSKSSLCDQNLSSNELYDIFLTKYLAKYMDKLLYSTMSKDNVKLSKHYKESEKWLKEISKTSSQNIFQKYSLGVVTLEDVIQYNDFQASITTYDVSYNSKNIIVGDLKRGIELWTIDIENKFHYVKTLTDKYGITKVHKIENIIYATGQERYRANKFQSYWFRTNYFLTFSYNQETNTMIELDRIKLGNSSRVNDWKFFDNNKKVATVSGWDKVHIIDISNSRVLNLLAKSNKARNSNLSRDLIVNEITEKLFELTGYGLNVIDLNKINLFNKKIENNYNKTFKGHQGIVLNQRDDILYSIHVTWENETTLYKYDMINPLNPKLLLSKVLDINFDGWNGGSFPQNMQLYNEKLYIANRNNIYIHDEELNSIKKIETPNIKNFHIYEDKIIYTKGKEGLSLILNPKN